MASTRHRYGHKNAVTHGANDGRMIPEPVHQAASYPILLRVLVGAQGIEPWTSPDLLEYFKWLGFFVRNVHE
jgi:hypothetical protein